MSDDPQEVRRQAAAWLVRLRNSTVEYGDLTAFRQWRTDPAHEAAFQEMEALWHSSGALAEDPDVARAVDDANRRKEKPKRIVLAAGMVGGLVALSAFVLVSRAPVYRTDVGQDRLVKLADGSTVRLDTNSRIEVHLGRGEREVKLLSGQAFFDVVHDAGRPFRVTTGAATVTDLGTRFSVRREAEGAANVVLVQGRVEVSSGSEAPVAMIPGQRLDTAVAVAPATVDVAAATSWVQGRLTFHDTPLDAAIAESNRYTHAPIVLEGDAALAKTPVDGTFVAGDANALALALCDLYGLEMHPRNDGALVISPKRAPT